MDPHFNHERLSVFYSTGELIPSKLDRSIEKISNNETVVEFLKRNKVDGGYIYSCNRLEVFGTEYKVGNYIVLPESKNSNVQFGQIIELLSCESHGYLLLMKMLSEYCENTDLYFLTEQPIYEVIPTYQIHEYHPLEVE